MSDLAAAITTAAAALFLLPTGAAATTIYGISGDFAGVTPSFVFAIDPDAKKVAALQKKLGSELAHAHEGLRFNIDRAAEGELPRFELKARRFTDHR